MRPGTKGQTSAILSALREACSDEAKAVAFLEVHRWGGLPACPRCGSLAVYRMLDAKTGERNKDFRWRCRDCKRMHTVRTGTIFEETRLPLRHWCFALWSACSSKKGVSALQISRECSISYKSALFLMHRVREGMTLTGSQRPKLSGIVEADETYVGGKPRHKGPHNKAKRGYGTDKTQVVGFVERGGEVRFHVMRERVTANTLKEAIAADVELSSRLITDESSAYTKVGREFAGGHETVHHAKHEYARGDVNSNTIEGCFSLIKRGVYGTFHSVSKKHLHRYVAEFEFRYNARKLNDGERVARFIKTADGKRLTYKQQVAG